MPDVLTPEQRKRNMKNIKAKDTKIEVILRRTLWNKGYRYRKNYKDLPGKPDIALTKYKIAIFCDSEFFHGKDWEILKLRLENGKNPDFWIKKIERNRNRDYENDKYSPVLLICIALLFVRCTEQSSTGRNSGRLLLVGRNTGEILRKRSI